MASIHPIAGCVQPLIDLLHALPSIYMWLCMYAYMYGCVICMSPFFGSTSSSLQKNHDLHLEA
jgi:hypothetical protein